MEIEKKLEKALELLYWVEDNPGRRPDTEWFKSFYLLTGNHMILTEVGWEMGEAKEDYLNEAGELEGILDEVNADDSLLPIELNVSPRSLLENGEANRLFLIR